MHDKTDRLIGPESKSDSIMTAISVWSVLLQASSYTL